METLARATIRGRWLFVGLWLLLTVAGAMATGKLADRWFEQFSIPGYSAYEANQRTLETFGTGRQYPLVAVFTVANGDIRDAGRDREGDRCRRRREQGLAGQLVVLDEGRHVRLGRSQDDVRGDPSCR